ncbi:hypothetical protein B0H14DRAFT_2647671 [Mycena olivaceomarginata]|nr:hypothetical protein B0H14DRAFT_2647671 [Mycena olivaceomarginata]
MARSLGEDAAGVDFVTNIMDPGSLQRYYAPKTNVIGGMPSQRLACRVDGTWVRTYVVLLEFSVVHIPSIGSLLLLTKEEPEIRHLCGALSGGVIDELWRPFQFGVVPIRRVASWKWKRELRNRSGKIRRLRSALSSDAVNEDLAVISVLLLRKVPWSYCSQELLPVGCRPSDRLVSSPESGPAIRLQRLKLRQGSAPFRIAGQVVSSRFAVKYNALTSTDVQGVFVLLPGQGARKYVVASQEMFGSTLYL